MRSPRPCITMGIQGHTQAQTTPAREERSTRSTFYTRTKPDTSHRPPRWSLCSPAPGAGSPARPPALPPHWLGPPSSWFPAKGEPDGRWGQDFGVGVLPGSREEPLLEAPRARGRWSSRSALGADGGPGGGRGRPSAGCAAIRCGAGRCGALRPCSRAAGSAESGAPPTAAAAPRVPPSRCRAPGP